ncbi:MAG: gamma-glutamylcyclotransferase family protein [Xanthobacteraceae bacterium]
MLHFAYGSNMDRAIMRRHAPVARAIGVASLPKHRFIITAAGYASVAPVRTETVHGVLWKLTPRDRVALDLWENVSGGQYRAEMLPVIMPDGHRALALVYVARRNAVGYPKAGYMELVLAAAAAWKLPPAHITSLRRWLPMRRRGAGSRKLQEFGWT